MPQAAGPYAALPGEFANPDLPRERTDVDAGFRAAGAPPVPPLAGEYHLARIEDDSPHIATVAEWMNRPHLARAWEFANPESWWARRIRAQNAGTYSVPVLLTIEGTPAAYLELYRPGRDVVGLTYRARPHDIGVHIGFGDPAATGHGRAGLMLATGLTQAMEMEPEFERVVFDPDWRNRAARKVALRAGSFDGGWHRLPGRTFHLLILRKDPEEIPEVRPDLLVEATPGEAPAPVGG